jgi:hypothetical protein
MRLLCVVALGVLAGCEGTAVDMDAGNMMRADAGLFDAGQPAIVYDRFTLRSTGWPTGARVLGAGVLDNALFVASDQGVLVLPSTETRWSPVTTPLMGDVKPTSLQRVDQNLVMTAAGASSGGVYVRTFDTDWTAVTSPPNPTWTLVKKSNEYLLSTTGGLYASAAVSGPWVRRSPVNTPLFTSRIARFVAAPAQQKIFATGVAGPLFESADLGITWTASTPRGAVEALAASGAVVVVSTAMDGQLRSDNYGNTFRDAGTPIADGVLVYAVEGTTFWAGGNGGLKTSTDNGLTFNDANDGLTSGTAARAIFFAGNYVIVDTADGPYVNQVE